MGMTKTYDDAFIELEAKALIKWYKEDESHVFLCQFCAFRGYAEEYISRWGKKNEVFSQAVKEAKTIEKARLAGGLINGEGSVPGRIFALKNVSNWADKQEIKQEVTGRVAITDIGSLPPDQQKARIAELLANAQSMEDE